MAARRPSQQKKAGPGTEGLSFQFSAPLWEYQGKGAWHFVTLPKGVADEVRFFGQAAKGFRMVAVRATIGASSWQTSLFPDSASQSYLLPVKAEVRKREALAKGQVVQVAICIAARL